MYREIGDWPYCFTTHDVQQARETGCRRTRGTHTDCQFRRKWTERALSLRAQWTDRLRFENLGYLMSDVFNSAEALREGARLAAVDFLRTELRIARTMLHAASTTGDPEAAIRRHVAARTAIAEVVKHLGSGSRLELSESERGELTSGIDTLAPRLALLPEARGT